MQKIKDIVAKAPHKTDGPGDMEPHVPTTMKAAQLAAYKKPLEIREVPVPKIGDNDVLIKIGAAGWCHTDYQVWEGVYESPFPTVPSHEPVGTVVQVGPKAKDKFKIGDRVGALLFQHQCHNCVNCELLNDIRFCKNVEFKGLKNDGGMAEYMSSDAEQTVLLPHDLPFEQAAPLMCAGATVWGGIANTGISPPETLGIIGIGGLGSLAVQFAKALGYTVVAIDNRPEGRQLAQENPQLKADHVVDFDAIDAAEEIRKLVGKGGLAAIVCCTDSQEAITWSLGALRTRGTLVEIGLPVEHIKFDSFDLIFQEKTIKGSLVASKEQLIKLLEVVDKHNIRSHVTTVTLDQVPGLPGRYMDPHLKGRLVMKIES